MKSAFLSQTSRRGVTLPELMVVTALSVVVLGVMANILTMMSNMHQTVYLQSSTDQGASFAMNRILREVREAKEVHVLDGTGLRIYYPQVDGEGRYDRTYRDDSSYIDYFQGDSSGIQSSTGDYLWRRPASGARTAVASDIERIAVSSNSPCAISLTVESKKTLGTHTGETLLENRVLYLRNN